MQITEDQLVDEIEYVLMVRERREKIEQEIRNIVENTPPISTSNGWYGRLHAELQAEIDWKNGKRPQPKTDDLVILKYFPLPDEPAPSPVKKPNAPGVRLPRILARIVKELNPDLSGRNAWNLIPEIWMGDDILEHMKIPDRNNSQARKAATVTVSLGNKKHKITFKAFQSAWEREKSDPDAKKWAKERKILKEKAVKGSRIL